MNTCTPHGKRRQTKYCSDNFLTYILLFGDFVEGAVLDFTHGTQS